MRVAVVDDLRMDVENLRGMLDRRLPSGTFIDLYASGEAFLASQSRYDLIFLDIVMEGMDGIETARQFRARDMDCLIVFLTSSREYVWEAFPMHAFDYLVKPVEQERLDRVLEEAQAVYPSNATLESARSALESSLTQLADAGRQVVEEQGYDYPVSAQLTQCWFPTKEYDGFALPAGNYTALRVVIGEGEGQNWWCVLYPNLCFLDAVSAVVPEEGKQKLEQVLTEEEYRQVTAGGKFEIRFKLPELLGSL